MNLAPHPPWSSSRIPRRAAGFSRSLCCPLSSASLVTGEAARLRDWLREQTSAFPGGQGSAAGSGVKTGLRVARCTRERPGVPCRGGNGHPDPVRPDSVLVCWIRSEETSPRDGAGRVGAGPRPTPSAIPPAAKNSILFPLPQKCKKPDAARDLLAGHPRQSGCPEFPVPGISGSATFRPYLTIGLALSFVLGNDGTRAFDRQRSVLVGLLAAEEVPFGLPALRRREGGRMRSLVRTRTLERLHEGASSRLVAPSAPPRGLGGDRGGAPLRQAVISDRWLTHPFANPSTSITMRRLGFTRRPPRSGPAR
jgi:hypothetical protein